MSKIDLTSRGWCDIVFEGRNKDYGAYRMRSRAGSRNLRALIILLLLIAVIGILVGIKAAVSALTKNNNLQDETAVQLQQLKKEEPKKKEEKKIEVKYEEQQIEKVQVKASIQFTVPKIEDDALVDETKEVKSQDKITKSNISIAAQDYAGDGKGGINIDDLKENQQAGGTQAPKEEEVMDNAIVEVQATYPGGEAALLKFVSDNLVYPSIAQEQELQGTVILRFRVEKDGSIGDIVIKKGLSKECDAAAVKVVKSLHRFTPARQQGHPVPVWFTLPIRFRIQ
jgi:protein TonB